jgi:hypothetical protein
MSPECWKEDVFLQVLKTWKYLEKRYSFQNLVKTYFWSKRSACEKGVEAGTDYFYFSRSHAFLPERSQKIRFQVKQNTCGTPPSPREIFSARRTTGAKGCYFLAGFFQESHIFLKCLFTFFSRSLKILS